MKNFHLSGQESDLYQSAVIGWFGWQRKNKQNQQHGRQAEGGGEHQRFPHDSQNMHRDTKREPDRRGQ